MSITSPHRRQKTVRTTIALPPELLDGIDREVAQARAESRNGFLWEAVERELKRRSDEAIDAAYAAVLGDPEYIRESKQIAKEFEAADHEAALMLEEQFGPYPLDESAT